MKNKFYGIFIFLILLIITIYKFNYLTFGLCLVLFLYLIIKKEYKLSLVYILFTSFIFISNSLDSKDYTCNLSATFKVSEVHENYCLIEQNHKKFLIYQEDNELKEGYIILLDGEIIEISPNGIPYLFSFKDFLNNKKVYYQIDYENIEIINTNETLQSKMKNQILNRVTYSYDYLNLLIFNSRSEMISEFYDDLIKISAVQLFVISGFHISFLAKIFNKILFKITKKKDNNLVLIFLFFYVYLLNFSMSALRAFLSLLLNKLNKRFKKGYSSLDINALIGIIFLLVNPKNLFLLSYQLSFLAVISLSLIGNIKSNIKNKLAIIIPFLITLPLICNANSSMGILNILMNYLLTPLVTVIYLLGIFTLIFPSLDLVLFYIFYGFEEMIDLVSNVNLYINFPYLTLPYLLIYYLLIYFLLLTIYMKKKRKRNISLISLALFITIWIIKPISNPFIIFLDVGQGDSCLIHGENNKYNILIDTGGSIYSDIATKKLIPYFNKEGISKLDLVIISHLDYDHYGALESLKNNFKISQIIDNNEYENIYYKDLHFQNLNNYYEENEEDENIKSSVLYFDFLDLKFLLTGDAPISIEKEIINEYQIDVDVLKVGHHGSKTSSSKEFIEKIKPEVAIISVGRNNRYGHPHDEVINNLQSEEVVIFRTDRDGSIKITQNIFKEVIIKTKL